MPNSLHRIIRHKGRFGNVSLTWQLFKNDSSLEPGQEFYETYGTVWFLDGEASKPITLHAIPDKIPEFNEFYTLKLVNASGNFLSSISSSTLRPSIIKPGEC